MTVVFSPYILKQSLLYRYKDDVMNSREHIGLYWGHTSLMRLDCRFFRKPTAYYIHVQRSYWYYEPPYFKWSLYKISINNVWYKTNNLQTPELPRDLWEIFLFDFFWSTNIISLKEKCPLCFYSRTQTNFIHRCTDSHPCSCISAPDICQNIPATHQVSRTCLTDSYTSFSLQNNLTIHWHNIMRSCKYLAHDMTAELSCHVQYFNMKI